MEPKINPQYFIQSAPLKLYWNGWESDTFTLQKNGWQLSVEQDLYSQSIRIAAKCYNLYMISDMINISYLDVTSPYRNFAKEIIVPINKVGSNITIELMEKTFNFKPIDAEPVFYNRERKSIEDFAIFAPALVRTNEIIVPNEDVDSLLDKLLQLQDPMLKKYYKEEALKDRQSNGVKTLPENKFVAQIISMDRRLAA